MKYDVFRCFQLCESILVGSGLLSLLHLATTQHVVALRQHTRPTCSVVLLRVLPFHASGQSQKGKKSLEVKKNRFDGDLGEVQLVFDPHSSRLREMS